MRAPNVMITRMIAPRPLILRQGSFAAYITPVCSIGTNTSPGLRMARGSLGELQPVARRWWRSISTDRPSCPLVPPGHPLVGIRHRSDAGPHPCLFPFTKPLQYLPRRVYRAGLPQPGQGAGEHRRLAPEVGQLRGQQRRRERHLEEGEAVRR